jgi:signal transduction histidine kinase
MNKAARKNIAGRFGKFPIGVFLLAVMLVCGVLAASSAYGCYTLMRLRKEYLQNRAHDIAVAIDSRARGPGRRHNPEIWQSLIDDHGNTPDSSFAYITLIDQSGSVLAGRNAIGNAAPIYSPGFAVVNGFRLFVFDFPLTAINRNPSGNPSQIAGWRLQVGLFADSADFIRRHAVIQAVVTGIAIFTLLALTYYFLQMLRRFVALQNQEQSERHLKALGTMSASLAHEIRNPLGAMKGLTQLVQEELPKEHNSQSLMKTIVTEAERLEALVSNLLSFARPRRPTLGDFDYAELLADVKAMLDADLQERDKKLQVNVEKPMQVRSDKDGLRQVLFNLLLNAVDVTPDGGSVVLSARLDDRLKNVLTDIDDQGPGLGNRDPEELFEPFFTTKTKGTGLGLAISRQIINNLGGTIRLKNLPDGGMRCSIIVPSGSEKHR